MLLCEADGESVLYTGDFRSNGRKSFDALLRSLPRNVDKLLCEGTTLSRESHTAITEKKLEERAADLFRNAAGPVFVLQSSMNIDQNFLSECEKLGLRIVTLHTSGHADESTIKKLIETIKPKVLIPIHTENAQRFREFSPKLVIGE